jgi:hypothetical protein
VSYCESVRDFDALRCGPSCTCATRNLEEVGVCWDVSVNSYCTQDEPICYRDADCVDDGYGDYCVPAGDCARTAGCARSVCVPACRAGDGDAGAGGGPPRVVVLD